MEEPEDFEEPLLAAEQLPAGAKPHAADAAPPRAAARPRDAWAAAALISNTLLLAYFALFCAPRA